MSEKPQITINGKQYEMPANNKLHVTTQDGDTDISVRIDGMQGGSVQIGGSSIETGVQQEQPHKKLERELLQFCSFLNRGMFKKSEIDQQIAELFPANSGVDAGIIKLMYEASEAQQGWTPWDQLPE